MGAPLWFGEVSRVMGSWDPWVSVALLTRWLDSPDPSRQWGDFRQDLHGISLCSTEFAERLLPLVDNTCWLMRRSSDGGTDYVCFRGGEEPVEMLEGYYLPPQMPFIKSRRWLNRSEALSCRHRLESSEGFRHGRALF